MSNKSDIVINITDNFIIIKSKYKLDKLEYNKSEGIDNNILEKVYEHVKYIQGEDR